MADKTNTAKGEAAQVFRQFAWNLAGTLAKSGSGASRPRPAGTGKR
ncbi:hypothetical protein [Devosia sp.]